MKATSRGLQFEKEFGEGLQQVFPFVIKLPDTRSLRLKQKIIEKGSGVKFHSVTGLRTPADFWTVFMSVSTLWECKQSQGVNKNIDFPTKNVKEHQIDTLMRHKQNGGRSYIVINIKNEELNEYYVIDILDYDVMSKDKASISRERMKQSNVMDLERLTPTKSPNGKTMITCTCQ